MTCRVVEAKWIGVKGWHMKGGEVVHIVPM